MEREDTQGNEMAVSEGSEKIDADTEEDTAIEESGEEAEEETEEEVEEETDEEAVEAEPEEELESATIPTVSYRTHVQSVGWQGWKKNGTMSGTSGQAKRLEAIQVKVSGVKNLGIRYKTHIQSIGWESSWKTGGKTSGTSGQGKRLEAIQIQLTGSAASKYDVWYCVHAQQFGWLDWAKNGAQAGTAGYAYRLEGIRIKVLPKGSKAPARLGTTSSPFYSSTSGPAVNKGKTGVAYNTHVQTYGWQDYAYNGAVAGTSGQAKRLEGIHISLVNPKYSGDIQYRTHIQSIGWQGWKKNGQMSGTSGQAKRLEAIQIKLTGEMAKKYDVYYRVHAQHFGWMGWARNGASAGTAGYSYRLEAIQIVLVNKGGSAPSTNLGGQTQKTGMPFCEKGKEVVSGTVLVTTPYEHGYQYYGLTNSYWDQWAPESRKSSSDVYRYQTIVLLIADKGKKVTADEMYAGPYGPVKGTHEVTTIRLPDTYKNKNGKKVTVSFEPTRWVRMNMVGVIEASIDGELHVKNVSLVSG